MDAGNKTTAFSEPVEAKPSSPLTYAWVFVITLFVLFFFFSLPARILFSAILTPVQFFKDRKNTSKCRNLQKMYL